MKFILKALVHSCDVTYKIGSCCYLIDFNDHKSSLKSFLWGHKNETNHEKRHSVSKIYNSESYFNDKNLILTCDVTYVVGLTIEKPTRRSLSVISFLTIGMSVTNPLQVIKLNLIHMQIYI